VQIAIASSSRVGTPLVDALSKSQHQLAYVVTNPDRKSGRGLATKANSFVESISKFDVSVHKPTTHEELHALLLEKPIDLVITASYGRLIKPEELVLPTYGWLNVHFSLLPKYRGASPVQQAILNGDELTGVSIFRLDEGMDTGPIFRRYECQIAPTATTPELLTDLAEFAAGKIGTLLDEIEDGLLPTPQSSEGISFAGKFSKEDGRIFPSHSSVEAERFVRALGDNPGVFLYFGVIAWVSKLRSWLNRLAPREH